MSSELEQTIRGFETPYLLEQYYLKRAEYGPEAVELMEKEVARRGLSEEDLKGFGGGAAEGRGGVEQEFAAGDFAPLGETFSYTDLILVHAILRDAGVPFFVDNPPPSSVVPLGEEGGARFSIHVLASEAGKARELIEQHFQNVDGEFHLRHTGVRDRLRAFSFHETRLTESQLDEEMEVALSAVEAGWVRKYGKRAQEEIDRLEQEKERVVFYFDNIDELLTRLPDGGTGKLRRIDLLTVIELLQLFCDEPGFPPQLDETAATLLEVFA